MEVKAPGVVKLLGEHAVVYGKLALAVAIDVYAKVSVEQNGTSGIEIVLSDLGNRSMEFKEDELEELFVSFKARSSLKEYIEQNSAIWPAILPYATITSRLISQLHLKTGGLRLSINSEIPVRKGFASSAACSAAFTVALLNASKASVDDRTVIELARDGDRVIHQSEGAGAIDVSTSYYGGYVSYSNSTGARKEEIEAQIPLLLVDTGPKKSTAEMVGKVAELYKDDKANTESMLNELEKCSINGIRALKANDMVKLGSCMFEAHSVLSKLGVSSDGLDSFVGFAKQNGFYGAKLSGGGGGGGAIGLCKNPDKMAALASKSRFAASKIATTMIGARSFYLNKSGK
jgi:mevalonate kinase